MVGTHSVNDDTLLQVVPVTVESNGKKVESFALLDQASETSLILQSLSNHLDLAGPTEIATLATFHGEDPEFETKRVNFNVLPRDRSRSFLAKNAFSCTGLCIGLCFWPLV